MHAPSDESPPGDNARVRAMLCRTGVLAFGVGLVVLYLLFGVRSYRTRRSDSGRTPAAFALRELGGGVRVAAAWLLWPFVLWPERDEQ